MGIARRWVFPILRVVVFAAIAAALIKLAFFGGLTEPSDRAVPTGGVQDPTVQVDTATVRNDVSIDATVTADAAVPVRATAAGTVLKVLAKTGQQVAATTAIATVRTQPDLSNLAEGATPPPAKTTTITAGAAGTLSDLPLLPGQEVAIGDSLAQVAPPTFSVVGTMPAEQQYRLLNRPTEGTVTITGGPQPFTCTGLTITTPLAGAGAGSAPASDSGDGGQQGTTTATTTVRCAVPSGVTVFSGIAAKLVVSGGVAENALVVPVTAVEGSAGGPGTVYVPGDAGGEGKKTAVTLGINDGKNVQITGGLKKGDTVLEFVPGREAEAASAQGGYGG